MKALSRRIGVIVIMLCVMTAMIPVLGTGGTADAASKIKLSKSTIYIAKGSTYTLKVKGTKAKVTWKSSKKSIATVSGKGKVKGKKVGTCYIYAKVKGKKLKCKVVVESKACNQARKLRNYILNKGKYDKSSKDYYITKRFTTDEGRGDVTIRAKKSSKKLTFDYWFDAGTPATVYRVSVVINLQKSTGPKVGTINCTIQDDYSLQPNYEEYRGKITAEQYNGTDSGVSLSSAEWTHAEYDEETGGENVEVDKYTSAEDIKNRTASTIVITHNAFTRMKPLLKKAGVSFKSIGFSKLKI